MKKLLTFLLAIVIAISAGTLVALAADEATPDSTVEALFNEYYNGGAYDRQTVIYLQDKDDFNVDEDSVNAAFHGAVVLNRDTYFRGLTLWMSTDSGYTSDAEGADVQLNHFDLGSFTHSDFTEGSYEKKNVQSYGKLGDINAFFVTMKDFADMSYTGWTLNDKNEFEITDTDALVDFMYFSASCLKNDNNYVTLTRATVVETKNGLEFKLYGTVENTDEFLVAKTIVTAPKLSLAAAKALGETFEKDTYTASKYVITGTVSSIANTTYGNMNITDGTNTLYLYGLYSEDGSVRYDAMDTKPVVGDTVTVLGVIGMFNSAQMKSGWLVAHEPHTCDFTKATCTAGSVCNICGKAGEAATGHNYVDGTCTGCGASEPSPDEVVKTVSKSHNDVKEIAGTDQINGMTVALDENISIVCAKGAAANAPQVYTESIRFYQNGATLTVKADNGAVISSVVLTLADDSSGKGPISVTGGTASALSDDLKYTITASADATTIVVTTTGTDKYNRVYVANIEVNYVGGVAVCTHENQTTTTVAAKCDEAGSETVTCDDCEKILSTKVLGATGHKDTNSDNKCDSCDKAMSSTPTVVLTITKDDFNSTSYAANNNTKTEGGYTYTSNQVMLQSSTMQWQKNNGYITVNNPGFTKMELTITAGSFTVTVGGKTVTGTTSGGVTTYDFTGLTGEVKIKVGGATGKTSQILFYQ